MKREYYLPKTITVTCYWTGISITLGKGVLVELIKQDLYFRIKYDNSTEFDIDKDDWPKFEFDSAQQHS